MGQPAARIGDMHSCPLHGGGPVVTGEPTVLIGGMPAARLGDQAVCINSPPDVLVQGEPTVLIGGKPASRLGDKTAHGGIVVVGCVNVLIGQDQGQCLKSAAQSGAVFVPAWE
jgi:uncharacterized Zn-binding protein involved in type VI secretion